MFDDGGEDACVDEAHEKEGLEDGVGELGGLFEELGGFGGVAHDEAFHLREYVEELGRRKGGEGFGDGVGTGETRLKIYARRERREPVGHAGSTVAVRDLVLGRRLWWWSIVSCWRGILFPSFVREVYPQLAAHDLVVVQIPHG